MKQYEVTFIVDPVLSGDEIKAAAKTYVDLLKSEGCTIVHENEMGLRKLAYPIKRKASGIYTCVEFQAPSGESIANVELAMRRDDNILRFLTVKLDKFGIKYNEDRRNGLIGIAKKIVRKEPTDSRGGRDNRRNNNRKSAPPKKAAPAPEANTATPATAPVKKAAPAPTPPPPPTAVAEEE